MPNLETASGKTVDVQPPDPAVVNAKFQTVMAGDGGPAPDLPKREPATPPGNEVRPAPKPKPQKPRAPEEKSRTVSRPSPVRSAGQRADGVKGLVQLGAAVPLLLSKTVKDDPSKVSAYKADALAIATKADEIADACVQVAAADPQFAAILDRICDVGPYGALITVAFGLGTQLMRNHRPEMQIPGTVHPDKLLAGVEGDSAAA